jgi:hypothetical protein
MVSDAINQFLCLEGLMRSGRPWTVEELRHKSFEDLHALWWVCVRERNRIATQEYERRRAKAGFGEYENKERDWAVSIPWFSPTGSFWC